MHTAFHHKSISYHISTTYSFSTSFHHVSISSCISPYIHFLLCFTTYWFSAAFQHVSISIHNVSISYCFSPRIHSPAIFHLIYPFSTTICFLLHFTTYPFPTAFDHTFNPSCDLPQIHFLLHFTTYT